MKKYRSSIILWLVFEAIAVWLWQATGNLFFLFNFSYIGCCIGFGGILFAAGWKYAREFTQFGVGTYMLVFLGLICRENMQIEGLWYYLLCGVWGAGTLHYAIAKIFGPLLFGRGWCGYACYYAVGITLAILLKDNRAFCKYICPITVFLKPMSYYSLIRIKCDEDKCILCQKCTKVCPTKALSV